MEERDALRRDSPSTIVETVPGRLSPLISGKFTSSDGSMLLLMDMRGSEFGGAGVGDAARAPAREPRGARPATPRCGIAEVGGGAGDDGIAAPVMLQSGDVTSASGSTPFLTMPRRRRLDRVERGATGLTVFVTAGGMGTGVWPGRALGEPNAEHGVWMCLGLCGRARGDAWRGDCTCGRAPCPAAGLMYAPLSNPNGPCRRTAEVREGGREGGLWSWSIATACPMTVLGAVTAAHKIITFVSRLPRLLSGDGTRGRVAAVAYLPHPESSFPSLGPRFACSGDAGPPQPIRLSGGGHPLLNWMTWPPCKMGCGSDLRRPFQTDPVAEANRYSAHL